MCSDSVALGNALSLILFSYLFYKIFIEGKSRPPYIEARRREDGLVVSSQLSTAYRLHQRMTGLLNHSHLSPGDALLISPCSAVHMRGMRFPIDVVFLNKTGKIIAIYPRIEPNGPKTYKGGRGGVSALELTEGQIAALGLNIGQHIDFR